MGSFTSVLQRSLDRVNADPVMPSVLDRAAKGSRDAVKAAAGKKDRPGVNLMAALGLTPVEDYRRPQFNKSTSEMLSDLMTPEGKAAAIDAQFRADHYADALNKCLPRPPGYIGDKAPSIARPTPQGLSARELEIARGRLLQDAAIGGIPSLAAYATTRNLPLNKTEAAVNAGMAMSDMMTGSRARGDRPPSRQIAPKSVMAPYKSVATSDDFVTFYHGSSPENIDNIYYYGLDLSKSKGRRDTDDPTKEIPENDFGRGHYVTQSVAEAKKSAGMMSPDRQAIMEYMISRLKLAELDHGIMSSPNAEWEDIIRLFKQPKPRNPNKNYKAPYEPLPEWYPQHDMITGPMYRRITDSGRIIPWEDRGMQTSVNSQKAIDIFNMHRRKRRE